MGLTRHISENADCKKGAKVTAKPFGFTKLALKKNHYPRKCKEGAREFAAIKTTFVRNVYNTDHENKIK